MKKWKIVITCLLIMTVCFLLYKKPKDAISGKIIFSSYGEEVINLSEEKDQDFENYSLEQILNDEQINDLNPLKTNKNGQTYGPYILGADLVAVISDNGEEGYILRSELEAVYDEGEIDSPQKARNKAEEKGRLTVYKDDGTTVIGYFSY